MSPFENVHVCSNRSRSCYDIEEEQPSEMDVESSGREKQQDVTIIYKKKIFGEINQNDNMMHNCVGKDNDNDKNKDSRLPKLSTVPDENKCCNIVSSTFSVSTKTNTTTSKRRLSNLSSHSLRPASSESLVSDQQLVSGFSRNQQEVKYGNLILIVSDNNKRQISNNFNSCSCVSSRTLYPSRFPVIVKIYRKCYEKYAIVTRTRRHPTMPSFFIKLKQSYVVQSSSNSSHFVVKDDDITGKFFTFEASSPEVAKEWIQAFSADSSCSRGSLHHHKQAYRSRELSSVLRQDKQHGSHSVSNLSPSVMTLPKTPLMPVLSESLLEADEE